jgi:hypothetical protein
MSFAVAIWTVCFVVAALVSLVVRSNIRAFAIGSAASVVIAFLLLLYVGHPVAGVSLADILLAAVVTAGAFAVMREVFRRAKG